MDVGAHYGGSLRPFALKNWSIFAFEPDNQNRNELIKSFHKYDNVIINDQAISNEIKFNQPFYTSDISTGISFFFTGFWIAVVINSEYIIDTYLYCPVFNSSITNLEIARVSLISGISEK